MLIRIYLKSGTVLPDIPCDEFTVERSKINGEIVAYEIKRALIPRPVYVHPNSIEAICRVDTEPTPDSALAAELEQELAKAVADLAKVPSCETCKHEPIDPYGCFETGYACNSCNEQGCVCRDCNEGSRWEWRRAHGSK